MPVILGIAMIVAAFYAAAYGPTAYSRWSDPTTKLGLFEERISNIPSEFARRSPAFADSWKRFAKCTNDHSCDFTSILTERDRAIAEDWPTVFDRLSVFHDWGEYYQSAFARDQFFYVLKQKGAEELRNHCLPDISYTLLPSGNVLYTLEGYYCFPQPDHKSG